MSPIDKFKGERMAGIEEQVLRATKEIIVKFIETGRLSPTGVHDAFRSVYRTIDMAVRGVDDPPREQVEPEPDE